MILSERVMTPKEYVYYMINKKVVSNDILKYIHDDIYIGSDNECYHLDYHNALQNLLMDNKLAIWDYPLSEIDYVFENDIDVVLVCADDGGTNNKEARWYEVPRYEGQLISL